jgi:hypothetical protein
MAETIFTSEQNIFVSHTLCFLTVYVERWLFYYFWESYCDAIANALVRPNRLQCIWLRGFILK